MTAPFSDELLSAYLDGELNAEERAYVEAQLRERVELRRLCDELRALRATLQAMPVARPPENFAERVLRQAERQMLADSNSSEKEAAGDDPPAQEPVELVKQSWLADPRWRAGIGVAAGLAACLLAMVFLYPPAILQNERSVALSTDALSQPSEEQSELATQFDASSSEASDTALHRNMLVRGREESLGFAEGSVAAKSAAPAVELRVAPAAPRPASEAPTAPPAPMQQEGQAGGSFENFADPAAGEADSADRRMARDKTNSGTRDLAAGANRGDGLLPGAPAGGADSFGSLGDRGSMLPGGAGLPNGGMRGGMGGGMGGLGGSMGGGGGMGSGGRMSDQPMPGGNEMRFGQATDAPADASPSNAPAADLADDSKNFYSPNAPPPTAGSGSAFRYYAVPLEPNAWTGTPVTTESLEQCTNQLAQDRFLLVKVTAPQGVQDKPQLATTAEAEEDKVIAENLFRKLLAVEQTSTDFAPVPVEAEQGRREHDMPPTPRPQVLVVDASSEMIRQSIDQLVSQPEVSVELAGNDSAIAKQLADQQASVRLRQELKEEVERLQVQPDMGQTDQPQAAAEGMAKSDEKPDGDGKKSAFDTGTDAERAEGKLAESELAKDRTDTRKALALGRPLRAAGEPATMPPPAAQPQDPAPVVERPSAPPAARSEAQPGDATPPTDAMAGKLAASVLEKGVAPTRVTFYILYRLAPDPVPVAPPAPTEPAGGR